MEVTRAEINEMIRYRQGRKSLRTFATELNISVAYLSDVLRNRRDPGPKLLTYLRLTCERSRTVRYFRARPVKGMYEKAQGGTQ